ncbi:hypothetical protein HRR83_008451 [Exophiala dermatitidis]|uniref:Uncharacterized protein n=2 Tax=Exophiala dermatitidis TaxID=5970 RepID=H6BL89_EXODN|nr:uncharacterized protein HMPREF1120_00061 [Exophiala dermatitidis NIH/UT8656]KAJ4505936.1 hypothetical protein HRR73_008266 [Exophiala dermatitidis]EHY51836.1 hypothetical protein HMPREF1120_00061 [Exophiala dermatitidis NIH/UT8656]KAJ4506478.1 hypothetical protein HRR74_008376 [Exophiala dermatitidis]KAJ4533656.1 hypothetical protein HRR77_008416 [Exophiala dermatitidis]KAJ4547412.1 hypothetical protein HRR76_000055 [Exophiala dermatitidis]
MITRSKRPSSAISPVRPTEEPAQNHATTPSAKRPKKKARFSDTALLNGTTGLTPYVGKAALATPKRRASTPAPARYPDQEEVQFTPFRECLEPRTIRRMRRHGLSDEMNQFYADQKANDALQRELDSKDAELKKLKAELEEVRRSSASLQMIPTSSQEQVRHLESEIAHLEHSISFSSANSTSRHQGSPTRSSPEPAEQGDIFQIYEDENENAVNQDQLADGEDALTMGLELESARQVKEALFRSSQGSSTGDLHFEDSPVRPSSMRRSIPRSPREFYHDLSKQLKVATNRAEEAELALEALNTEIKSLGFPCNDDSTECISNIKHHFRQMRLDLEHVVPGETAGSFDNARLIPEIISKLKMLAQRVRDREAELKSMRDQQRCLKGNFDHAIIAAEKANNRVKELEDVIDKNAEDLLHQRMRAQALERETKELESNNRSLINAIEKYREEVKRLEELVQLIEAEQASRLQDVRAATMAELNQQISDMEAKVAAESRGRRAAEESAVDRLRRINELEADMSAARQRSEDVREKLSALEAQLASSNRSREEEVGGLNSRISSLSTALSSANAEIDKLRKINVKLEDRYRSEVEHSTQAVERMQTECIRSATKISEERKSYIRAAKVRYANWELESDDLVSDPVMGPMTPASIVRFSDVADVDDGPDDDDHVPGSVEMSRGKNKNRRRQTGSGSGLGITPSMGIMKKRGRRRYDSGIGMESLSEVDEDNADTMTPDLSSDPDVDVDVDVMA